MDNTRKERCWGKSMNIYASHVLASWGDRMWSFAVGLYLVVLFPESLQLTAIYGFLSCVSAILLGAFIGKWVDRTERLKAAQISLLLQNTMVIICAALLIVHLHYTDEMSTVLDGALGVIVISLVILFAIIASLASIATKLVLEKDWIVVLSGGNETLLSKMNATMRTIDLSTFILAPILVGQIFTYGSHVIGAACIAGWNIFSGSIEYYLLIVIYKSTPELNKQVKPLPTIQIDSPQSVGTVMLANNNNPEPINPANTPISPSVHDEITFENLSEISLVTPKSQRFQLQGNGNEKSKGAIRKNISSLKIKIQESRNGWRDYFAHPVRNAGIGLAFLYMTVLGFDSITTGYAYSQGVSESILGILTAAGAVFGILGSLSFPFLRNKLGKLVTGVLGFGVETTCLVLCLVSIVTPGSPFTHRDKMSFGGPANESDECPQNYTRLEFAEGNNRSASVSELWNCNISVILLLAGIVTARFGLWVADLSVVQIFQERVPENQRGILNGVQASLNQCMNLVKFLIVIILPKPGTFAYLIVASWLFVFSGWVFFMVYAWKNRSEHITPKYSANIPTVSSIVDDKSQNGNDEIESGPL